MRRFVSVIATIVGVIAAVTVAVTLARTSHGPAQHQAARGVVPTLPGSVDIVRYERFGGSRFCDVDSCSVSLAATHFTLPAAATSYHSTLTVSLRYRASGKEARFGVVPHIAPGITMKPHGRRVLNSSNTWNTATFVVRPELLAGGVEYTLRADPVIPNRVNNANIKLSQVVFSLHAWYAGPS